MWINKLIYIAVLLYAGVLALLYTTVQSLYAFGILLLFGILQVFIVMYLKTQVHVRMSVVTATVNKNEPIKVGISVENRGILPISCVKMIVSYENNYEHLRQYQTLNLSVNSKSTHTINFTLSSVHTGAVQVKFKKIYVYDFLRIFHQVYKTEECATIKVFPEVCMMEGQVNITQQNILDSEVFSKIKSGDDPSEVFDIREYKEGDKIHRIHWKLSSKRDVVMVKEYSLPIACNVGIMVSLALPSDVSNRLDYYDALLSSIASISYQLIVNEQMHFITWYDQKKEDYHCVPVENLDELYQAMDELLECSMEGQNNRIIAMHHAAGEHLQAAKLYYVCGTESAEDQSQLESLYSDTQIDVVKIISEENAEDTSHTVANLKYCYVTVDSYKENIEALQL